VLVLELAQALVAVAYYLTRNYPEAMRSLSSEDSSGHSTKEDYQSRNGHAQSTYYVASLLALILTSTLVVKFLNDLSVWKRLAVSPPPYTLTICLIGVALAGYTDVEEVGKRNEYDCHQVRRPLLFLLRIRKTQGLIHGLFHIHGDETGPWRRIFCGGLVRRARSEATGAQYLHHRPSAAPYLRVRIQH